MGSLLCSILVGLTFRSLFCSAWMPANKVPSQRIVKVGSLPAEPFPDRFVFPSQGEKDEGRNKLRSFAFEFCGSSSSTAMFGGKASPEYVEAELMDVEFPQMGEFLWRKAKKFSNSEHQLSQAHRIQQAYREWCEYYKKKPNKDRLGVFTTNFLAVQDFHERTGTPLIMNEYSDLTEEEWKASQQIQAPGSTIDFEIPEEDHEITPQADRIRKAYWEWCHWYGKTYDEQRLKTFASNFLAVEKYHQQTKSDLVLNEFADMTDSEYQNHLRITADIMAAPKQAASPEKASFKVSPPQSQPIITKRPSSSALLRKTEIDDPITSSIPSPTSRQIHTASKDISRPTIQELMNELQSTIASLHNIIRNSSDPTGPSLSSPTVPSEQPLDSLVIEVLKKQDDIIADLEISVEGLRDVQEQSGKLIQLLSHNQMKMTEIMNTVQNEIQLLQSEVKQSRQYTMELNERLQRIEMLLQCAGITDVRPEHNKQSLTMRTKASTQRVIIEPNPFGLGTSTPNKPGDSNEHSASTSSNCRSLENKRRPI